MGVFSSHAANPICWIVMEVYAKRCCPACYENECGETRVQVILVGFVEVPVEWNGNRARYTNIMDSNMTDAGRQRQTERATQHGKNVVHYDLWLSSRNKRAGHATRRRTYFQGLLIR